MPNLKGGKNYKKSKHAPAAGTGRLVEAEADQMYGRVIKILGDRNMRVYCNDNASRICRVCGAMRKRVFVNLGDLVLISIRDLSNLNEKEKQEQLMKTLKMKDKPMSQKEAERGDIIHKYQHEELSKLKKVEGINEKLFMQLETVDGKVLGDLKTKEDENDYVGIEFDASSSDEDSNEEESKEDMVIEKKNKKQVKAKESKHSRVDDDGANDEDKEIDIDDI
jgi:initiation factor 1A